jgi:4-amino-4-deoxy-L-arabinose transferase-like glycosyltransferase
LLTANVIFALWQFAEYFKSKKLISALLGGLGVGLAMISKGPIGIFVPAMAVFTHLLYTKQWKTFFSYKIVLSGFILLLVLAIGLTGIFKQFGWEGLKFFLWENNAGRISGDIKGNSTDYFFYFHTALYIFLPWGILFFISLFFEIKELFKQKNAELFILGGIVFYWIIISYARAKAPHYFMVLSPFMAILSAKWMLKFFAETNFRGMKKAISVIQYSTMVFIWILLLALSFYFFPTKNLFFITVLILLFGVTIFLKEKESFNKIFKRSLLAIVAVNFALNVHVFPQIFTYQSVLPACEIFNVQAKEGELLNTYLSEHRELFFYAKYPGHFLYNENDLQNCLQKSRSWVYTNDDGLNQIKELTTEFEVVQSFKHRSISKLTPGFINPSTRNERLSNMYLIKINTF